MCTQFNYPFLINRICIISMRGSDFLLELEENKRVIDSLKEKIESLGESL